MTLDEFLAQYERNTHNRDVPNIPMADAQRYLELAAQQYGNIGAIQDWSQRYADPGGNGAVDPQQMWALQNGVRLTPMTGTTYDANGANTGQITGTTGSLGQFRDPETGKYYNLSGQYDAQGNLQDGAGIYEYSPHAGNNAFSAMGPAVRTIGGAMLGAYGLSQLAPAAAAGSGGLAEGTYAAGVVPSGGALGAGGAATGGAAATGAAAGGAAAGGGAAAAGGGLLSQIGSGASAVGGFLRDNANWLAPAAGAVAGYLGSQSDDITPYGGEMSAGFTPEQTQGLGMIRDAAGNIGATQAQMHGLLGQATTPQTAATNPLFGLDNPALTGAIDRAQQDLSRNYNTLVAPKFSMGSSFGSSGLAETEALARKDYTDSMANIGTQMRYQNYGLQAQLGESQAGRQDAMGNANANRAMQGVSMAGNIGLMPAQMGSTLMNAGASQQQSNQAALDRQYNEFVRQQVPQSNQWAGALGGAMLGSQMGGFMQPVQAPNYMPQQPQQQQGYFGGITTRPWNGVAS